MAKTKNEIIADVLVVAESYATLAADTSESFSLSKIRSVLDEALRNVSPEFSIRICEDFAELQAECCETCHHHHPHYELALIDIEGGGNAWICCSLDRALNPRKHAQRENSPEYQDLQRMFNGDVAD